jgi:hypothetical protein
MRKDKLFLLIISSVFVITAIGLPGLFQSDNLFISDEKKQIRELHDLSLINTEPIELELGKLNKKNIPVFSMTTEIPKIDFGALQELSTNIYFLGKSQVDSDNNIYKVLEKKIQLKGISSYKKIALISKNKIYRYNKNIKLALNQGNKQFCKNL